jgi:hypothetical protein
MRRTTKSQIGSRSDSGQIAVNRRGDVIGLYVPLERDEDEVRSAVAKLGNAVEKFLAESGMSEDELSAAFSPEETED